MNYNPKTKEAYQLFHYGILALTRAELQGFRIDMDYVEKEKLRLTHKIDRLEKNFKDTKFFRHWQHTVKGSVNVNSNIQLSNFIYKIKKIKIEKETASGQGATDDDSLKKMNIPELNDLLEMRKLKKVKDTYLGSFAREQVNGYIHPFFNLHLVQTYRSCVAKGTKILIARDFLKYPNGVPIEKIREGDFIYCFDNNLKPTIQKVLWSGKTGFREVIRVHYSMAGSKRRGYIEVTPEHKIRLIDGSYEQAQNLIGDFRRSDESIHLAKIRTLSCYRFNDTLRFTGHLKHGIGILESRFIYSNLIGPLSDKEIVHHKNEIHLDHTPSNLKKTTLSLHSTHHVKTTLNSSKARKNNIISIQKAKKAGVYKRSALKGEEHPNYLNLSEFSCYKLLAQVSGKLVKVNYDFNTFKKYLKLYNINADNIQIRYDKFGNYIWKSKLTQLSKLGRAKVSKILGHNYYKLIKLYTLYDLSIERRWGNQFGEFKLGNHNITKIEWLHKKVAVYDIEVEKYHNFFANDICVHNSSDHPNFQNIPIRDEESMQITRRAIFPRPGHQLLEVDFKAIEVAINACYNKDTTLVKYVTNPKSDMHADMTKQIFKMDNFDKEIPEHYVLRQAVKNGFVFPEFYGDYYKNCATNILCNWGKLSQGRFHSGEGIPMPKGTLADHLINVGLPSFKMFEAHLKSIEKDMWENRFPEYAEWKERWWKVYQKYGYIDLLTGFRCSGVMDKNQVINTPGQGTAFHCLLWSLIETDRIMQLQKWDTKIVSQIHDSMILDVKPDELNHVAKTILNITTKRLREHWDWIIVPMFVDMALCPVDASWAEKENFKV